MTQTTDATIAALERLEALAEKATRGPWAIEGANKITGGSYPGYVASCYLDSDWPHNTEFIAASRTAIPALCRALRLADEAIAKAERFAFRMSNSSEPDPNWVMVHELICDISDVIATELEATDAEG